MFRNSMLGCIITCWIHGGSGHGILRSDLHRKHLQRYFMQIIRLKSDINNKTLQEEENRYMLYHFIFCEDILLFPLFLFTYLCIDSLFAFCTLPMYLNLVTLSKTLVKRINKKMWTLHAHLYEHKCLCIFMSR